MPVPTFRKPFDIKISMKKSCQKQKKIIIFMHNNLFNGLCILSSDFNASQNNNKKYNEIAIDILFINEI
jgi:hypothetical protein